MVRQHTRVAVVLGITLLAVACSFYDAPTREVVSRAPRKVIVLPGVTVFDPAHAGLVGTNVLDDVRTADTIICRASNGDAGAVVPEPGQGVGNSAGMDVAIDRDGRIVVHCAHKLAQA